MSTSLSEDHFLLKVKKLDPAKDKVVAYSRQDGHCEALLLQNEIISQVYRDPSQPGGWGLHEVATGAVDMVAAMIDNSEYRDELQLHVFYRDRSDQMTHLVEALPSPEGLSSGQFETKETLDWSGAGELQLTTNAEHELLAFAFSPSTGLKSTDAKFFYYFVPRSYRPNDLLNRSAGVMTGFACAGSGSAIASSYTSAAGLGFPKILIYAPVVSVVNPGVGVFAFQPLARKIDQTGSVQTIAGTRVQSTWSIAVAPPAAPAEIKAVQYVYEPSYNGPVAVVRTPDGSLYSLAAGPQFTSWTWAPIAIPNKQNFTLSGLQPSLTTLGAVTDARSLANLFYVDAGQLTVLRQAAQSAPLDSAKPVFNPAITLQPHVAAVSSQARNSTGDELIVVGSDGQLQVLTRTDANGWAATVVHLPDTEPVDVSTYRVQLTLSDDWGAAVANEPLAITASAPVPAFVDGVGVWLSDRAVTLVTDQAGQVTIPVIADGMYAPMLTIACAKLPSSVSVSPSEPVNSYMAGKSNLAYMPPLDAGGLQSAKADDGSVVFPGAQNKADADDAVASLAQAARAGAAPSAPPPTAIGHDPVITRGRAPKPAQTVIVDGVALNFDNLHHDAMYAIKTGAAKVTDVKVAWKPESGGWISHIIGEFAAWAHREIEFVIHGLQDAAHVFHSVFNKLAAIVVKVVKWLEVHVLALLGDAIKLATLYEDWMLRTPDVCAGLLTRGKLDIDDLLEQARTRIHDDLSEVKKKLTGKTINQLTAGKQLVGAGDVADPPTAGTPSSGWLQQKVAQDNPPATTLDFDHAVAGLLSDMRDDIKKLGTDVTNAFDAFRDAIFSLGNPKNFGTAGITTLLDAFEKLVDLVLQFAKSTVDLVVDLLVVGLAVLKSVIGQPLPRLPLVSSLLEAAGMDKNRPLTLGLLIGLLISFPTVLAYKIRYLSFSKVPFAQAVGSSNAEVALDSASARSDLAFCQAFAAFFDAASTAFVGGVVAGAGHVPAFFEWSEIITPVLVGALHFPAHGDDLPFKSAIQLDDSADVLTAATWVLGVAPAALNGIAFYVSSKSGAEDGAVAQESTRFLTALVGATGGVTGTIATIEDHKGNVADAALGVAATVLDHTAPVLAWGLAPSVVKATERLSPLLWGLLGSICILAASAIDIIDEDASSTTDQRPGRSMRLAVTHQRRTAT